MQFTRKASLWFAALVLSGCAVMPENIAAPDLQTSKRVAVVSLLGTNFHMVRIGTTVFGNAAYDVPVAEWNIDGMVEQALMAHIGKNGSRTPMVLQHDPGLGARLEKSRSAYRYNYEEALNLAKQQNADTLLVVQTRWAEDLQHYKPGYGFFERTFFGKSSRCAYSLFSVHALSVQTGKHLSNGHREWPCSATTEIEWKETFEQYTAQEKLLLRKLTEEKINQGVTKALTTMGY
jgi:hypothetical protein